MKKKIDLIVANPAGNTTLMVLTPTERKDYQTISDRILSIDYGRDFGISFNKQINSTCEKGHDSLLGEQVAFILPETDDREYPSMEMSGLEFCGNASRAFAYYTIHEKCKGNAAGNTGNCGTEKSVRTTISVSGCEHSIDAIVDLKNNQVQVEMPVPESITSFTSEELGIADESSQGGILVDLGGITHLVVENVKASQEKFDRLKDIIYKKSDMPLPAFGVMFIDSKTDSMTPVVYVHDVNTTYFEGSCASGTTAASCALATKAADGIHEYTFVQPAGTLYTTVAKENGQIKSISLKGLMEMSPVLTVEI